MSLKKQYLRYEKSDTNFGLVASPNVDIKFISLNDQQDKYVAVAAAENVIVYDLKTQAKQTTIEGKLSHVSAFEICSRNEPLIAIGYEDGSIKLFNYELNQAKCSFIGHKTAITSICFDEQGMRIASGSKDTDIAIWDIVSESGLFRLKGHKKQITHCAFMKEHSNILVSSSTDCLIKFWDLNTQHCFKTLFGHKNEIWSFGIFKSDRRLITGSNDLKVFKISFKGEIDKDDILEANSNELIDSDEENNEIIEEEEKSNLIKVKFVGSILRASKTRLVDLTIDSNERLMMCNGNDSFVECFKLRNDEEIKLHFNKKMRKIKRKLNEDPSMKAVYEEELDQNKISFKDEFQRLEVIKASANVKFCSIQKSSNNSKQMLDNLKEENEEVEKSYDNSTATQKSIATSKQLKFAINFKVACLLNNNNFELHEFDLNGNTSELTNFSSHGHRSFVNSLSISEDNYFILSSSKESVKVWNRVTKKCVNTIELKKDPITCSTFVPGNRFCVVGTKKGNLIVINIGSSEIVESYKVSEKAITCLYAYPDGKGLVAGSDDKQVKFWNYELIRKDNCKQLVLEFERSLEMEEGVTCIKLSENMKILSIALLDSTVKIYYFDTLKFFLSLYGHKFPVQCMDISSDCTLIATGSADKNVKIWGLDFGDCHKSIFSHDDAITGLQFVHQTHYYFTCSLDRTIKQWDADSFEKILTLRGHESEVKSLLVTSDSKFVLSSGKDLSMRVWQKTNEILMIEDELDTEREIAIAREEFLTDETVIAGERNEETGLATRKNFETLKSTEKLIEAIDCFKNELARIDEHAELCKKADEEGKARPPELQPNILFSLHKTNDPNRYLLEVIKSIKSSEIEECLLCLPFNYVIQLLTILSELLERNWEIELICRFSTFLAR